MTIPVAEKEELRRLVAALIPFGEDEKELRFWESIFEDLTEHHRAAVLQNLREELSSLTGAGEAPRAEV